MPHAPARMLAGLAIIALCNDAGSVSAARSADPNDRAAVIRGKQVYAAQCASCHGRRLEGQPLWRMADAERGRRAPAEDGSGPNWLHSDAELFAAVSTGRYPGEPATPQSRMPSFAARLPGADILAVLAFIKARWPTAMRVSQAALNPGQAGQPPDAGSDWRFPPDCKPR